MIAPVFGTMPSYIGMPTLIEYHCPACGCILDELVVPDGPSQYRCRECRADYEAVVRRTETDPDGNLIGGSIVFCWFGKEGVRHEGDMME